MVNAVEIDIDDISIEEDNVSLEAIDIAEINNNLPQSAETDNTIDNIEEEIFIDINNENIEDINYIEEIPLDSDVSDKIDDSEFYIDFEDVNIENIDIPSEINEETPEEGFDENDINSLSTDDVEIVFEGEQKIDEQYEEEALKEATNQEAGDAQLNEIIEECENIVENNIKKLKEKEKEIKEKIRNRNKEILNFTESSDYDYQDIEVIIEETENKDEKENEQQIVKPAEKQQEASIQTDIEVIIEETENKDEKENEQQIVKPIENQQEASIQTDINKKSQQKIKKLIQKGQHKKKRKNKLKRKNKKTPKIQIKPKIQLNIELLDFDCGQDKSDIIVILEKINSSKNVSEAKKPINEQSISVEENVVENTNENIISAENPEEIDETADDSDNTPEIIKPNAESDALDNSNSEEIPEKDNVLTGLQVTDEDDSNESELVEEIETIAGDIFSELEEELDMIDLDNEFAGYYNTEWLDDETIEEKGELEIIEEKTEDQNDEDETSKLTVEELNEYYAKIPKIIVINNNIDIVVNVEPSIETKPAPEKAKEVQEIPKLEEDRIEEIVLEENSDFFGNYEENIENTNEAMTDKVSEDSAIENDKEEKYDFEDEDFRKMRLKQTDEEIIFTDDNGKYFDTYSQIEQNEIENIVNPSLEKASLSDELINDLKEVFQYIDNFFATLPNEKLVEFSNSKYYDKYNLIFDKLGI